VAASTLIAIGLAHAEPGPAAANAEPRPAVVELFTSQGCSSCPPADEYVGELTRRPGVLALSFHVDYWDDLGWRDRFSSREATERQTIYARALNLPSVYTPQMVIDGHADYVGSNRRAVDRALSARRDGIPVEISVRDADVVVGISALQGAPPPGGGQEPRARSCDVVLVAYLRHAVSSIGRGENAGRKLEEFNIVRTTRTLGLWDGQAQTFRASLASLPSDATDVAVLLQPRGQAAILGAATKAIR